MNKSIIPAVAFNRLSAAEQLKALRTTDSKRRTESAIVANIFAAKERHDKRLEAARERTAKECPWVEPGEILFAV